MAWYYASEVFNGTPCGICHKPIIGKDVTQKEFEKKTFNETRDQIFIVDFAKGLAEHADCVWNQENKKSLDGFFGFGS